MKRFLATVCLLAAVVFGLGGCHDGVYYSAGYNYRSPSHRHGYGCGCDSYSFINYSIGYSGRYNSHRYHRGHRGGGRHHGYGGRGGRGRSYCD